MIRSLAESIYTGKIIIGEDEMDQSNLLKIWYNFMINPDQEQQNNGLQK